MFQKPWIFFCSDLSSMFPTVGQSWFRIFDVISWHLTLLLTIFSIFSCSDYQKCIFLLIFSDFKQFLVLRLGLFAWLQVLDWGLGEVASSFILASMLAAGFSAVWLWLWLWLWLLSVNCLYGQVETWASVTSPGLSGLVRIGTSWWVMSWMYGNFLWDFPTVGVLLSPLRLKGWTDHMGEQEPPHAISLMVCIGFALGWEAPDAWAVMDCNRVKIVWRRLHKGSSSSGICHYQDWFRVGAG